MKTLLTLFSEGQSELQTKLDKATSLEQIVQLVQNKLDGIERIYISDLSIAQVRLVSSFLETLRYSITTLVAINETQVSTPPPEQLFNQTRHFSFKKLTLKLLQGIIYIGILGTLFSTARIAPGVWVTILLTSLLIGLEVALELDKDENRSDYPQSGGAPQLNLRVDSKVLIDNIVDALNTIDIAVTSAKEVKKTSGSEGIEELPELMNFLQRLLGASLIEKPQMIIELTKLLPQILMEQGIRALVYRPDDNHSPSREYFDFEPSIDGSTQDYITITPALWKGDRLLRRGRVIEPAYSKIRE
jgi:hypothetical protein